MATSAAFETVHTVFGDLAVDLDLEDLMAHRRDIVAAQFGTTTAALLGFDVDDFVDFLLVEKLAVVTIVSGLGTLRARLVKVEDHLVFVLLLLPRVVGRGRTMGVRRVLGELVLEVLDAPSQSLVLFAKLLILRAQLLVLCAQAGILSFELVDSRLSTIEAVEHSL
jgi:hypothetical protein